MTNEESTISARTWARSAKSINKIGYMDGAFNGQSASYQFSFDTGYKQGLEFGLKLGFCEAMLRSQEQHHSDTLIDPRKINCQMCIDRRPEDKIDNLYNRQEERNNEFLNSVKLIELKWVVNNNTQQLNKI